MIIDPAAKVSTGDLNTLISELDVQFVWLSHCLVSPGFRLEIPGGDFPGIHYNLSGRGRMLIKGLEPIELVPHTLIVVPNNSPFKIEVFSESKHFQELRTVNGMSVMQMKDEIHQFVAGDPEKAEINLICGFFKASYGQIMDLFAGLQSPIVEVFHTNEQLGERLRIAEAEFLSKEIGSSEMSSLLLKQVIILLLRRSLASIDLWCERFSILRDARIAKVMAVMAADPGDGHTVKSLADIACMSRSNFMTTFAAITGKSPMAMLREIRMRHATRLLKNSNLSIDQVSKESGYNSKNSFARVFRQTFGKYPNEYRADSTNTSAAS
ncbi:MULTISPECIES: helix-turn-helix domain-containing protein [Niastella]|uniref:Helix-turn-helix domain-containing protein n=1 Tax=Niastella soli TaxID=2821487 RepID=A0ABS3YX19_9BACT|nr:helix-turn-helix domain-containing protein [Niastella soli]MBO9202389.1 helix-turn-helix domain-containing protein [Niastella soli]